MASLHPTMVLESRVMLRATLPRINGQRVESEIDLNTIIGNQNGTSFVIPSYPSTGSSC